MSRTLYFHIGPQETGESIVEAALTQSNDARIFKDKAPNAPFRTKAWPGRYWYKTYDDKDIYAQIDFADELAVSLAQHNTEGDVVFSSAFLSWVMQREYIDRFSKVLNSYFDDIRILIVLRRQDRVALDLVRNASRAGRSFKAKYLGPVIGALPDLDENIITLLDYYRRFALWADVFGEDALDFVIFDEYDYSAILRRFEELTGLELSGTKIPKLILPSKSAQYFNQKLRDIDVNIIGAQALDLKGGPMMPARAQARGFFDYFIQTNNALNQHFEISEQAEIFDDDFSAYPDEANEKLEESEAEILIYALVQNLVDKESATNKTKSEVQKLNKSIKKLRGEIAEMGSSKG